jgi:hypothetical protein
VSVARARAFYLARRAARAARGRAPAPADLERVAAKVDADGGD